MVTVSLGCANEQFGCNELLVCCKLIENPEDTDRFFEAEKRGI